MNDIICKRVVILFLLLSPIFAAMTCAQTIAYSLDSQIWGMDMHTRHKFLLINPPGVLRESIGAPAWFPDGKKIAAVIDGDIWLADVPSKQSHILVRADNKPCIGIPAWSKDGKSLYVGRLKNIESDGDGGLWQFNVRDGKSHIVIQPEDVDLPIHNYPLVSADGHYLISSGMIDGVASFYAIDFKSNTPIKLPNQQVSNFVTCYAFDKSCKMLILGEYAGDGLMGKGPGGVWRWDLTTNRCSPLSLKGQSIEEMSISPNGKHMIIRIQSIVRGIERQSSYLATTTGTKVAKIKVPGDMSQITWLDNDTFVADNAPTGDPDHTNIIRYNTRTGKSRVLVKGGYGVAVTGVRAH